MNATSATAVVLNTYLQKEKKMHSDFEIFSAISLTVVIVGLFSALIGTIASRERLANELRKLKNQHDSAEKAYSLTINNKKQAESACSCRNEEEKK